MLLWLVFFRLTCFMKYLVKKVIKGKSYYYLQYKNYTKNLGHFLPGDLKGVFRDFFRNVANREFDNFPTSIKKEFRHFDLKLIENSCYWYLILGHEVFLEDYREFYREFIVLFTYNSNKTEGSKTKKNEIDKIDPWGKKKAKTKTEIEIMDSFAAFNYAFSDQMEWNLKGIREIHRLLLRRLDPVIAGNWKDENNVAPGENVTTDFKEVTKAMSDLLKWFHKEIKNEIYPPVLALKFYCKFEKIHPFLDGNGRVGRILLNAILDKFGYPPLVFFADNKVEHSTALRALLDGRSLNMYKHFLSQFKKTYKVLKINF